MIKTDWVLSELGLLGHNMPFPRATVQAYIVSNMAVFSFLHQLTTCHCSHSLLWARPCSNRSISSARRAHSSKPTAAACGGRMVGHSCLPILCQGVNNSSCNRHYVRCRAGPCAMATGSPSSGIICNNNSTTVGYRRLDGTALNIKSTPK